MKNRRSYLVLIAVAIVSSSKVAALANSEDVDHLKSNRILHVVSDRFISEIPETMKGLDTMSCVSDPIDRDSVWVSGTKGIYVLKDTDGDGIADQFTIFYSGDRYQQLRKKGSIYLDVRRSSRGRTVYVSAENGEGIELVDTNGDFIADNVPVDAELVHAGSPSPEPTAPTIVKAIQFEPQLLTAFIFGVVFIITLIILAVRFPHPTDFQYKVFRIVLSLAAAGIAAMIPGLLSIDLSKQAILAIRAAGASAVFVIVYFFNPAALTTRTIKTDSDE